MRLLHMFTLIVPLPLLIRPLKLQVSTSHIKRISIMMENEIRRTK